MQRKRFSLLSLLSIISVRVGLGIGFLSNLVSFKVGRKLMRKMAYSSQLCRRSVGMPMRSYHEFIREGKLPGMCLYSGTDF